jgi:hypothetical protein
MDAVESEVAKSDDAHADLHTAISKARLAISRANLDPSVAQKARTLLDKAQALPRSALTRASGLEVLDAVRALSSASADEASRAVEALETAVLS